MGPVERAMVLALVRWPMARCVRPERLARAATASRGIAATRRARKNAKLVMFRVLKALARLFLWAIRMTRVSVQNRAMERRAPTLVPANSQWVTRARSPRNAGAICAWMGYAAVARVLQLAKRVTLRAWLEHA